MTAHSNSQVSNSRITHTNKITLEYHEKEIETTKHANELHDANDHCG